MKLSNLNALNLHVPVPLEPDNPKAPRKRDGTVPEESPGFDDEVALPLDREDDGHIPDEERVQDMPS